MQMHKKKILVLDVHASEAGALSILDDFYEEVIAKDPSLYEWEFIVSTPKYKSTKSIKVLRFPWIKKSFIARIFFDLFMLRSIIKKSNPCLIINLQNKAINIKGIPEIVYLHLPFILTNYSFKLFADEFKLWIYQNIYKYFIFRSYKKVDTVIVQTKWMKDELINKTNLASKNIKIIYPKISKRFRNLNLPKNINYTNLFYPATGFSYKNHIVILKAMKELKDRYDIECTSSFTINSDENKYTKLLEKYASQSNLNINFLGKIDRDDVIRNYLSSCMVFPSYIESFGLPLLEARSLGIPVIALKSPFSEEILHGYRNSTFFNNNDHIELANKILKINSWYSENISDSKGLDSNYSLLDLIIEYHAN